MVSASGAMMMGAANDLIVVFLGLEILSIALYVLAAFNHRRAESGEAALKYFVLGGFSSAIFLYGIALTYGATGTTNLPQIADYLSRNVIVHNGVLLGGMALLLVGFGFKIAAVPFHMWSPDVYEGSPSPVTGFMAAVAKAGAFAALLRVFVSSFPYRPGRLAAGGVGPRRAQPGARRGGGPHPAGREADDGLLVDQPRRVHPARRGGGHRPRGVGLALLRLHLHVPGHRLLRGDHRDGPARATPANQISDYRGLARRQPLLALAFAVLLLGQAGVPFTTGFLAKLGVVEASVDRPGLRAGRHGHGVGGGRRLLLPPPGGHHVLARRAWYGRRAGRRAARPGRRPTACSDVPRVPRSPRPPGPTAIGQPPGADRCAARPRTVDGPGPGAGARPDRGGHRDLRGVQRGVRHHPRPDPGLRPPGHPAARADRSSPHAGGVRRGRAHRGYCRPRRNRDQEEQPMAQILGTAGASPASEAGAEPGTSPASSCAALALVLLIAFVIDNSDTVKVGFVFFNAEVSLIWVLLIAAVLGVLVDRLVIVLGSAARSPRRRVGRPSGTRRGRHGRGRRGHGRFAVGRRSGRVVRMSAMSPADPGGTSGPRAQGPGAGAPVPPRRVGRRRPTGPIRSRSSPCRPPPGSPTWSPSATAGWPPRPSPSSGGRPR